MNSHLKFFDLAQSPFVGDDRAPLVLGTPAMRALVTALRAALAEGTSRLCVRGEAGIGRTSFGRALPRLLGDEARVALIPDPTLPWPSLRAGLPEQWGLDEAALSRPRLLEAARERRLLLVVDRAEEADDELLDHLDVLLGVPEDGEGPGVQAVLLARSAPATAPPAPVFAWIERVAGRTLDFDPMPPAFMSTYLEKHLKRAGWSGGPLFTADAADAIHARTRGVPGAVSALCEALLVEAAARSLETIDAAAVEALLPPAAAGEARDAGTWTLDDAFDEAPAAGTEVASPTAGPREAAPPSEHDTARSETPETDPLLAPPTEEELRAIRGSALQRNAPLVAVCLLLVVLGGLGLAWLLGDGSADETDSSRTGPRDPGLARQAVAPADPRRTARDAAAPERAAKALGFVPGGYVLPGETAEARGSASVPAQGPAPDRLERADASSAQSVDR